MMASKKELEIRLAAAQEEFARYDERLSHLAEINKKLETCYDQLRVAQTDAEYFKHRAEAAEKRVAELEAEIQKWRKFVGLDHPSWDAVITPDNDWVRYLTTKSVYSERGRTIITFFDGTREIIEDRKSE